MRVAPTSLTLRRAFLFDDWSSGAAPIGAPQSRLNPLPAPLRHLFRLNMSTVDGRLLCGSQEQELLLFLRSAGIRPGRIDELLKLLDGEDVDTVSDLALLHLERCLPQVTAHKIREALDNRERSLCAAVTGGGHFSSRTVLHSTGPWTRLTSSNTKRALGRAMRWTRPASAAHHSCV